MAFHCGMCAESFTSKAALKQHSQNHPESTPDALTLTCDVCNWPFNDTLALEEHKIASGHSSERYSCDNCGKGFVAPRGLKDHMKPPGCAKTLASFATSSLPVRPAQHSEAPISCDRCSDMFSTRKNYNYHRSFQANTPCSDHNYKAPKKRSGYVDPDKPKDNLQTALGYQSSTKSSASDTPTNLTDGKKWCKTCKSTFPSMSRFNGHLLRCTAVSKRAPKHREDNQPSLSSKASKRRPPPSSVAPKHLETIQPSLSPHAPKHLETIQPSPPPPSPTPPRRQPPPLSPPPPPQNMTGSAYEMAQAKEIQGKMLRLLVQTDIFIHHDGKMSVCGIDWTRISVEKQRDVSSMFQELLHLRKDFYDEYLLPPKAFAAEYTTEYPASEFTTSPAHDRFKPGLSAVAIACSKILLPNGCQEVVKMAAVDVLTGRILMDHLVCTSGAAPVADWRSHETGLFSWHDMEQARTLGYKVFKGWSAVRAALYKIIDKHTILVGHNLRSDLDALRMVHGRAVDVAKVAEKRAGGPLSKAQLGIDSLCRSFPAVELRSDPQYGRDVLMNAFAVREMGLWAIKNRERFEREMRQKSRDYVVVMPKNR